MKILCLARIQLLRVYTFAFLVFELNVLCGEFWRLLECQEDNKLFLCYLVLLVLVAATFNYLWHLSNCVKGNEMVKS